MVARMAAALPKLIENIGSYIIIILISCGTSAIAAIDGA